MVGISLKRDCPHCATRHVAQTAVYAWETKSGSQRGLFNCGHCGEGIIREYFIPKNPQSGATRQLMQAGGDGDAWNIQILQEWPQAPSNDAPSDCPNNVDNYFRQAADSLRGGNFDAAGIMFRKTLEASTKAIDTNLSSKPLAKRISELVSAHLLTPALGDWANEIRLGGNDAAHEEDPFSREEAQALRDFTENFLRYVFTLPAAVARRSAPVNPRT